MIVVDSSVLIGNLRNQDRPAVRHFRSVPQPSTIMVGDIVMLEVLRGARDERQAALLERDLRRFRYVNMLNASTAVSAARHYRTLRRTGITISKIPDLLIATFCIANGYALLHDDRDYNPFVDALGLKVVQAH